MNPDIKPRVQILVDHLLTFITWFEANDFNVVMNALVTAITYLGAHAGPEFNLDLLILSIKENYTSQREQLLRQQLAPDQSAPPNPKAN